MSVINLGTTVDYTVQPATKKSLTTVTLIGWIDQPAQKVVVARVQELPNPVTLWSGAAYDAIGDWTEAQAEAQLKTVLTTPQQ
jgi:hypothetical protein